MKKILTLIALVFVVCLVKIQAQTQTVCTNSTKIYDVNPNVGSTYYWSLKNGLGTVTTISGHSDSILITYGSISGTDTLRVVEVSPSGCIGDTAKIRILLLPVLFATISGTDSICSNNASINKLRITITGTAGPWNVTYTDGITPVTVNGVTTSPYIFNSPVYTTAGVRTYSITSLNAANICSVSVGGTASVSVFVKPSTILINTY